ncbi:sensor histidine kinase [Mobilicoccus pelagius]|uniref:histidine kinase n=1 Tax=Mobilicoccus pelagius NBRC 104925 TaxID=1089455 RepID=H5URJ9_9MICO|nr:HAMP domain-containing sensor histidine kinase [Mobilicoccus pelagius]GAB48357.1 two-component histidine kinase PhoR [Mobilicoccus pelagius NBRC 104925]
MTRPGRRLTGVAHAVRARIVDVLRRWSLTWRLIAVLVVLLVFALTLSNVATGALMRAYLVDRTDAELHIAAGPVANKVLEQYRYESRVDIPRSYAVVVMRADGVPEAAFWPVGEGRPAVPPLPRQDPRVRTGTTFTVGSVAGRGEWRVISGPLANGTGTYAVAASLEGIEQTVRRMLVVSTIIGVLVVAACVIIGWLGFRRAFRPLRAIEDTAAAIAAGDLTSRVPEHAAHDEVASLSRSINVMLGQIEASFAGRQASETRMRRFVTDASHELRTPLATIRGYAELYRQGAASSPEAVASSMQRIEGEATRMSVLVEDLLTLARLDNRRPMQFTPVDLTVIAGDVVQDARARASTHALRLTGLAGSPLGPAVVDGDDARLRQVVTNLVANALHHTPAGTSVTVRVGTEAGRCRVEVADDGPGIDPDAMSHLFERFYRTDPARGRQPSGGHGLGLAIVAAIVQAHGGRTGVAATPGGGATFLVDLPAGAETDDPFDLANPADPLEETP